jgi:hypothetical protein
MQLIKISRGTISVIWIVRVTTISQLPKLCMVERAHVYEWWFGLHGFWSYSVLSTTIIINDLRLSQRLLWRMSSSGLWRCVDLASTDVSLSPCSYIAGSFWLVAQSAATCSRWFTARGSLYPEDGGDTFLRNVGWRKIYTAPHPRRRHSLQLLYMDVSKRWNRRKWP